VDLICLPSGFKPELEYPDIKDAISQANEANVLIFAAPSDRGNFHRIFYPANQFQWFKLFCIFSTNPNNKPSCHFNPAPLEIARYNFAILGEDIEFSPLEGQKHTGPRKGTSFSTIIAAAVAAQILDFSRHPEVSLKPYDASTLREVHGMSAVFLKMAVAKENGYLCLAPWELLGDMDVRTHSETEIRTKICWTILSALKEKNNQLHK
jgi:hypothetical protein